MKNSVSVILLALLPAVLSAQVVDPNLNNKEKVLRHREKLERPPVYYKFAVKDYPIKEQLRSYKSIQLTGDLSKLQPQEKECLKFLIEAAKGIDELFWMQTWGDKKLLLDSAKDEDLKKFINLNYGPWDRLNNNKPFVQGVGEKPLGARFYPEDMTEDEWKSITDPNKNSPYTVIERDPEAELRIKSYTEMYMHQMQTVMNNLQMAGNTIMGVDPQLGQFLMERSTALLNNQFNNSDIAWLGLLNNNLDIIIGPIENYEDERYTRPIY
jgi:hypothetical protein